MAAAGPAMAGQRTRGVRCARAFVWVVVALWGWGGGGAGVAAEVGFRYLVNASNIAVVGRNQRLSRAAVTAILQEMAANLSSSNSNFLQIHPNHSTHVKGVWAAIRVKRGLPAGLSAITMLQRARTGWALRYPQFTWGTPGTNRELQIYWILSNVLELKVEREIKGTANFSLPLTFTLTETSEKVKLVARHLVNSCSYGSCKAGGTGAAGASNSVGQGQADGGGGFRAGASPQDLLKEDQADIRRAVQGRRREEVEDEEGSADEGEEDGIPQSDEENARLSFRSPRRTAPAGWAPAPVPVEWEEEGEEVEPAPAVGVKVQAKVGCPFGFEFRAIRINDVFAGERIETNDPRICGCPPSCDVTQVKCNVTEGGNWTAMLVPANYCAAHDVVGMVLMGCGIIVGLIGSLVLAIYLRKRLKDKKVAMIRENQEVVAEKERKRVKGRAKALEAKKLAAENADTKVVELDGGGEVVVISDIGFYSKEGGFASLCATIQSQPPSPHPPASSNPAPLASPRYHGPRSPWTPLRVITRKEGSPTAGSEGGSNSP